MGKMKLQTKKKYYKVCCLLDQYTDIVNFEKISRVISIKRVCDIKLKACGSFEKKKKIKMQLRSQRKKKMKVEGL